MCTGQEEGSSEGLCSWDALSQQNHQGGQRVHLTLSVCREKGKGISGPLRQVQLVAWATRMLPSKVGGEEAALPLHPFAPTSGFSLAEGGEGGWGRKRKEVPCSHRPCYALQQAPCQSRFPLALKRFRCLPLCYEVSPRDLKGCRLLQLFRRTSSMEGQCSLPSQTPPTL